jgi:hypothetical protein
MIINNNIREKIRPYLPWNYRSIVVERLKDKNVSVHPNTVSNVFNGSHNIIVAIEILQLYKETRHQALRIRRDIDEPILGQSA